MEAKIYACGKRPYGSKRKTMTAPFCSSSSTIESRPSCHTLLFHGRLSGRCLRERNLSAAKLPCVRQLFITGYPGSATRAMADRLAGQLRWSHTRPKELRLPKFLTVAHEVHSIESDILVSWLSRTDAWQLRVGVQKGFATQLSVDKSAYALYPWMRGRHANGMGNLLKLSRCLYRRVLLQTREPLATLRSVLTLFCGGTSYFVMADQLIARSGSTLLEQCDSPVAPNVTRHEQGQQDIRCPFYWQIANSTVGRRPLLRYLLRSWFLWVGTAFNAADAHFAVERDGRYLANVCALGGIICRNESMSDVQGTSSLRKFSHSTYDAVQPITWHEAYAADAEAAALVRNLAERLGYSYEPVQALAARLADD